MLISNAYAQAAPAASAGFSLESMMFPVLMIVVFYFLLIRPQQKRAKEQKALIDGIKAGDEVVTLGGMLGKVSKVADGYITVEISQAGNNTVEVVLQRAAVQTLLPKGTIKSV